MNLSKREFLQVLSAASVAGMGLGRFADASAQTAADGLYDIEAHLVDTKPFGQTGLSYTFACTVCGKTFKRGTYDATLNPHKNKQGWPCPGRIGALK